MPAAGSGRHNYNFTDMVLDIPATYYYQLKLVDMDGRYKYSSITYINNKHVGKTLDIFHNPATDFITIVSNKMQLSVITNTAGQVIRHLLLNRGSQAINIGS